MALQGEPTIEWPDLAAWAAWAISTGAEPSAVLAGAARHLAHDRRVDLEGLGLPLLQVDDDLPPCAVDVPANEAPAALGYLRERLLAAEDRTSKGAVYTPVPLAGRLCEFAWSDQEPPRAVWDPAVGAGSFLLGAAELLKARGVPVAEIIEQRLLGGDLDPLSVEVCRAVLALWALAHGDVVAPGAGLAVRDGLLDGPSIAEAPIDLVVGNPPFLNQLKTTTARSREMAAALEDRYGHAVRGYVDTAAVFQLAALRAVEPDGRVCLIQPRSFLVAAQAEPIRDELLAAADIVGMWWADEHLFEANVRVCAPVLAPRPSDVGDSVPAPSMIRRAREAAFEPAPEISVSVRGAMALTWGPTVAVGLPTDSGSLACTGIVGDYATATAGFRDQYYGLVDHIREAKGATPTTERPALVTSGLIDPLVCLWGSKSVKFAGQHWDAPVVDMAALAADDETLARWVTNRLRPKVVVATQSKVIEVFADVDGVFVPSVPVVSVECAREQVWHVATVLTSPPLTVMAVDWYGGAGLSASALKLAAKQILRLPLPADRDAWDEAAAVAASGASDTNNHASNLVTVGTLMCHAYGVVEVDATVEWWLDRLPLAARAALP